MMDNFSPKTSSVGQVYLENLSDAKSRRLQMGSPLVSKVEVLCPKPRRATGVPYVLSSLNKFGSRSRGGLPMRMGTHGLGVLDAILAQCQDGLEGDLDASNQAGFLCGSPPVRTNNPVIQDAEFAKLTASPASPLGSSLGMKPPGHDKGSPSSRGSSLGSSPKVRIEGFNCGSSPDTRQAVSALA